MGVGWGRTGVAHSFREVGCESAMGRTKAGLDWLATSANGGRPSKGGNR